MDLYTAFFIHELTHLLVGATLGLILFKITGKLQAFLLTLAISLLIDADHLLDYLVVYGFSFNLNDVISGSYFDKSQNLFILLHSWELASLLTFLGFYIKKIKYKIPLLSLGVGMLGHLMVDQITHFHIHQEIYFLTIRIMHGFLSPRFW